MFLSLQAKDVDLLSKNDYIGSTSLNLSEPIKACILTGRKISINKAYYLNFLEKKMGDNKLKFENNESFWIDLLDGRSVNGKARVSIDIIPKEQATLMPVGEGRSEPNHSPYLPPPTG